MEKLLLLYGGTCLLAWLSQQYYPMGPEMPLHRGRHFLRDPLDIFSLLLIIWLTFFSGLRTAYNDTGNYIRSFLATATTLEQHLAGSEEMGIADNPLFQILQVLIRGLTDNYHIWFLVIAFFNSFVMVKFLRHYAASFPMAILLFHAVGTYVLYIAAMKQAIAVAIVLCAIPFALKRKWVQYYLLIVLAMLFHTHSFMLLIVPLLMGKPWGKVTWILAVAAVFAMATYNRTLGAFVEYAQAIGANVAEEEVFDGHGVNVLRVAVYGVVPLLALFFRGRLFTDSTAREDFFVNMSILSWFILGIGLVEGGNLFARMAGYFEWATAVSLPWMIGKLFNRKTGNFITGCAMALYTVCFLYEFGVSKGFGAGYSAISVWEFVQSLVG